jgi:hypothetical protein
MSSDQWKGLSQKMTKKELILDILGWFFLVLGIVSVITHVFFGNWRYTVWFCNHSMIITGIAVLCRNRFWLTAMLNWSLIPLSLWTIDFIGKVVFNVSILGMTEYMFVGLGWMNIVGLQHLFTVPLMLYSLYLLGKPSPKAWLGTTLHAAILGVISYFFITADYNINCAHTACKPMQWLPYYIVLWPVVAVLLFYISNKLLVLIFRKSKALK